MRKDVIDAAHGSSLKVNVWTPNKKPEWEELISQGVDGIVTDDPKALSDYLIRRGLRRISFKKKGNRSTEGIYEFQTYRN